MLLRSLAAADRVPLPAAGVEAEVSRRKAASGCRQAFYEPGLRADVEREMRLQRLIAKLCASAEPVTEPELRAFFDSNRERFLFPALFQSAQIECNVSKSQPEDQAFELISQALAALQRDVSFAETAERYSDCKGSGGLMPVMPEGELVPEYEDAVHHLEIGARTGIFTTPFGFHVAELRAKWPARQAGFAEVRGSVRAALMERRKAAALDAALRSKLAGAEIVRTGADASADASANASPDASADSGKVEAA